MLNRYPNSRNTVRVQKQEYYYSSLIMLYKVHCNLTLYSRGNEYMKIKIFCIFLAHLQIHWSYSTTELKKTLSSEIIHLRYRRHFPFSHFYFCVFLEEKAICVFQCYQFFILSKKKKTLCSSSKIIFKQNSPVEQFSQEIKRLTIYPYSTTICNNR